MPKQAGSGARRREGVSEGAQTGGRGVARPTQSLLLPVGHVCSRGGRGVCSAVFLWGLVTPFHGLGWLVLSCMVTDGPVPRLGSLHLPGGLGPGFGPPGGAGRAQTCAWSGL